MSVTIAEIDQFLERLMNEEPGKDYAERLGRKWWHLEHKAADTYGCPDCKEGFEKLVNVKHNTVNIHLGKPVVDAKLYEKGVELVLDAYRKYKQDHHHSENMKIGSRMVHVVSDDPTAIDELKDSLTGTKVSH